MDGQVITMLSIWVGLSSIIRVNVRIRNCFVGEYMAYCNGPSGAELPMFFENLANSNYEQPASRRTAVLNRCEQP